MQRYFISEKEYMEGIILSDDVFHIVKVMRNKIGDLIEICYDNKAYLAKITNLSNELVNFEIVEEISNKKQNKPNITLIQGLAKGDKNDDITKHSTELGVDEIILLQMKRSIVKIEANKVESKLNRFKKIAKEASEQSHRNSIPEVKLLTNLNNIDFNNYDLKLLLDEEEAKKIDGRLLSNIDFNNVKNVIFVIGPEGGIDDKERLYFIEKGFIPVSIGNNILRTETASLAFLAMINYIYMKN
jgi:16S rRNA (uracil1498-N3)-methyltransferase